MSGFFITAGARGYSLKRPQPLTKTRPDFSPPSGVFKARATASHQFEALADTGDDR
jgi:hypothetical protein